MQTTIAPLLSDLRCVSFDQRGVGASTCEDGRYDIDAYVDDIEAIRTQLGIERWHVLGHSWGGLLVQLYANDYPERICSLALSSSSLGVAADWKATKRAAFATDRRRAGLLGTARFVAFAAALALRGRPRTRAMRRVMTETWHNYFLDPSLAPDPDQTWLDGCSAEAMLRTDHAISRARSERLDKVGHLDVPVLVLYGEYDIFGDHTHIVRERFRRARQITLSGSGHLHWLQQPDAYRAVLRDFYAIVRKAVRPLDGAAAPVYQQRPRRPAVKATNAAPNTDHSERAQLRKSEPAASMPSS
jgi:proline iminopeptidase